MHTQPPASPLSQDELKALVDEHLLRDGGVLFRGFLRVITG